MVDDESSQHMTQPKNDQNMPKQDDENEGEEEPSQDGQDG